MPNLPTHIYLAHGVGSQLGWEYLQENRGSYFLGCTAPDVRAMIKWPREKTHFVPLDPGSVGAGVRNMLDLYPELADHRRVSPATRAFLLGYIGHLIADELWITTLFQPNFSSQNPTDGNPVEAHLWDRALQLDMDRQARLEMDDLQEAREVLAGAERGVDVPFLGPDLLEQWREWGSAVHHLGVYLG